MEIIKDRGVCKTTKTIICPLWASFCGYLLFRKHTWPIYLPNTQRLAVSGNKNTLPWTPHTPSARNALPRASRMTSRVGAVNKSTSSTFGAAGRAFTSSNSGRMWRNAALIGRERGNGLLKGFRPNGLFQADASGCSGWIAHKALAILTLLQNKNAFAHF